VTVLFLDIFYILVQPIDFIYMSLSKKFAVPVLFLILTAFFMLFCGLLIFGQTPQIQPTNLISPYPSQNWQLVLLVVSEMLPFFNPKVGSISQAFLKGLQQLFKKKSRSIYRSK
jgi:TRAP-type mannitol/chloroaromatic compound transport system permease small subunit